LGGGSCRCPPVREKDLPEDEDNSGTGVVSEEKAVSTAESPTMLRAEQPPSDPPPPTSTDENSFEKQIAELSKSVTCAEHYIGLMHFDKAADKLEAQLVILSSESSPLHNSDLHVEVLLKYGSVLRLSSDHENAVDAFNAADEILATRPTNDFQAQRRRVDTWIHAAKVHQDSGSFVAADKHLTNAVCCIKKMLDAAESGNGNKTVDGLDVNELRVALHEAQGALAQVCVQKEEYGRAEELYASVFKLACKWDPESVAADLESCFANGL